MRTELLLEAIRKAEIDLEIAQLYYRDNLDNGLHTDKQLAQLNEYEATKRLLFEHLGYAVYSDLLVDEETKRRNETERDCIVHVSVDGIELGQHRTDAA